jgi:hypothetical protein
VHTASGPPTPLHAETRAPPELLGTPRFTAGARSPLQIAMPPDIQAVRNPVHFDGYLTVTPDQEGFERRRCPADPVRGSRCSVTPWTLRV